MSDETAYEDELTDVRDYGVDEPDTLPAAMAPTWDLVQQYEATLDVVDPGEREFDNAAARVITALDAVRTRLALHRAERDAINAEIRRLVGEEELLARMARIAQRTPTATSDEPADA